jgi:hypothetical protein
LEWFRLGSTIIKIMRNLTTSILLTALFYMSRCVPPQHRLDFDLNQNALVSCDEQLSIKHLRIMERDGEGIGYEILLRKNYKGSSIIYLDSNNQNYYCNTEYPIKFEPNKEYIISSVSLDSGLEMSVFTNGEGKIDSVANPLGCIK